MTISRHHHIKFREAPGAGGPDDWAAELKKMHGVTSVKIEVEKNDVFIEYDLGKCREEAIEKWMVNTGFVLDDNFMQRLKRGWIHYTEDNELDALNEKPGSCCDVEEVEKKRKELE